MPKTAEKHYMVHYYEIDFQKRALPTTIINYFQDIAVYQSEELGVGLDFLATHQLGWSLYQWDISIHRYPLFAEKVKIKTSPIYFDKFNAYRNFEMLSEAGETLVTALTRWVLLDTNKMKLTIIPEEIYSAYEIDPDYKEQIHLDKLKEPTTPKHHKELMVRYSDIDTNKHVNNAKYVEWVIESIPLEIVLHQSLKQIKVMYKNEAKYGDVIYVDSELIEEEHGLKGVHRITDQNNKILCLVETRW